jgi:hypothetical protein
VKASFPDEYPKKKFTTYQENAKAFFEVVVTLPEEILQAYPEAFTDDAYMWQYIFILSYSFTYYESTHRHLLDLEPISDKDDVLGFLIQPAICVVNHGFMVERPGYAYERPSGTLYYKRDEPLFKMQAQKYFNKGEEVVWSYGEKSNADLLFYYGFVIPKNPYDLFYISIEESGIACHLESERLKNGSCEFVVKPSELNVNAIEHLLRYYYEDENYELKQYVFPIRYPSADHEDYFHSAFLNYRYFVKNEIDNAKAQPLREVRRELEGSVEYPMVVAKQYVEARQLSMYSGLRYADANLLHHYFRLFKL